MMKRKIKIFSAVVLSLIILMIGVGVGSVYIEPADILKAIYYNLTSSENLGNLDPNTISIIWKIRLPRAILAFVVGGALAVSGAVMQSVLTGASPRAIPSTSALGNPSFNDVSR